MKRLRICRIGTNGELSVLKEIDNTPTALSRDPRSSALTLFEPTLGREWPFDMRYGRTSAPKIG